MNLHEQFRKDIKSIITNIDTIDTYTEDTKIDQEFRFICLYCENEYTETIHRTLMGYGCPTCKKKPRTDVGQSPRVFKIRMKYIHPNLEVLSEFKSSYTLIDLVCKIDGHKFKNTPSKLLIGRKCPKCSKLYKPTTDEFRHRMKSINDRIEIVGEYVNSNTPIMCKCLDCGNTWMTSPGNLTQGTRCRKCKDRERTKNSDVFREELAKVNKNITLLGEYINSKTKIKAKCNKHNYIWYANPRTLLRGGGCMVCGNSIKKTIEQVKQEVYEINTNVEILGEYDGMHKHIRCKCLKCNNIWYTTPSRLIYGRSCPICKRSIGEEMTDKWIKSMNINKKREYSFVGLVGDAGGRLLYDFFIDVENTKCIIEYHGKQHYSYVEYFHKNIEKFNYNNSLDRKKRLFAISKNMYFIEIPYLINNQQDIDYFLNFHLRRILMNCSELEVVPRVVIDMIIKAQDLGHKIDTLKALTSWIYSAEEVSDDLYLIRYKNSIFEDYDRTEELTLDEFIDRYKISDKN